MLTRMLMTTVAAFVLAGPVAAQDQAKPQGAQKLEQAQQEQQSGAADQPATAAQSEPAEAAPDAAAQPPAIAAEGDETAPSDVVKGGEKPAGQDVDVAEDAEETPPPSMQFLEEQQEAQFLAADEVIGEQVMNSSDEEVGEIADLVMDQDQKLVGVVLSVGGFLGIGEKWVAVPVDSVQFPSDDQPARLLVDVTKEQLENAPDFVTRDTVEAQEAAERAQTQMQQQQTAPPAATAQ
jgi:sporulation protein YlmC with PRC-barrel domain